MRKSLRPMKLQLFASDDITGDGGQGAGTGEGNSDQNAGEQQGKDGASHNQQQGTDGGVDYAKIQSMLDTATAKKEQAVLRSFFQQQGLSEEEVTQAIADFKDNRKKQEQQQQTDAAQLQSQVAEAQKDAEQAHIELEATKVAMTLGIEPNSLPYVLKLADFSSVKDKDGKISADLVKEALNKVLTAVPQFKAQKQNAGNGFQIGGTGQSNSQTNQTATTTVPTKRWNRFNN